MSSYEKRDASSLMFDLRNFTPTLQKFEQDGPDRFLSFLQSITVDALKLLKIVEGRERSYYTSTGDGFLLCFFGEFHYVSAFLFALVFEKVASARVKQFEKENGYPLGFGMGLESGSLRGVQVVESDRQVVTYIGQVINTTARIESVTKMLSRTNLIIGQEMNQKLVKLLFNADYSELINQTLNAKNSEEAAKIILKMNELNQKLLVAYIFEHNLKGVESAQPLFRLSPSLAQSEKPAVKDMIKKLTEILRIDYSILAKGFDEKFWQK
ncbi:hypothetical protein JNL27_02950 [bacterium]|nr:hypothetical protein [bacterium]